MTDDDPHLTEEEARAGATPYMTRVILTVSMALIVGIFVVLYLFWSR